MKTIKLLIICTLCILSIGLFSQNSNEQSTQLYNKFLIGGWRVSDDSKFTRITTEDLDTTFLFSIRNTGLFDSNVAQFVIYVGDLNNRSIVEEGGGLFAESNWLAVTQKQSGSFFSGNWEVIGDETPFSQVDWKYYPDTNTRISVANFEEDKLFVLSINFSSNYCSGGKMTVFVDGNPIRDNRNRPLKFLEGSSILGKGKKVEIVVEGNCSTANAFYGNIRIPKP